jgi:hypothetical protein
VLVRVRDDWVISHGPKGQALDDGTAGYAADDTELGIAGVETLVFPRHG